VSELPPGLDDFGRRLEEAAAREIEARERERPPRRRRRWRNLGLPVLAALLAAAVSAGAVRLVDGDAGNPITPDRGDVSKRLQAPRDPAVIVSSAPDNPAGGPPWVVRAFTNAAGRDCVQVGRLRAGVFGQVQGARFRPLPPSAPGTCATGAGSGPLIAVRRTAHEPTVVFGLALDRTPLTVSVGGRSQRVRPAGLGAFVAVFAGATPGQPIVVRFRVDGRARVLRL
jgi:hypothetical protein